MVRKLLVLLAVVLLTCSAIVESIRMTREEYHDQVEAVWTAQIIAVLLNWQFEHKTASTLWVDAFPHKYTVSPIDDDWYYEMVAIRAFEKYGINMTVQQLGQQWKENSCGSWGSSEQTRLNLAKGIKLPDAGHPRYNKLRFSIGPQFSADVYGALAPGLVNVAGRLAREYGHINGYAEGTDGAVFMAAMVSLGFSENDTKTIVRKAAQLIHQDSPYRKCLDMVISMAEKGKSFEEVCNAIEDRWHIEYPATNNAVANGGIVAASVWFGEGDFLNTVNLAARAADFTDADCNSANAASVVGAMHGMRSIPQNLVTQLGDRIVGDKMGSVNLTPPVDEKISDLAKRTAAVGEKIIAAHGAKFDTNTISINVQEPVTQPAELFELGDLMQYWNTDWQLDRAGFGGAGGGMPGIRGITFLEGDVLATYPRDEVRGLVLRRTFKLSAKPSLHFQVGCDAGRAWELNVYVNNKEILKQIIENGDGTRKWHHMSVDLKEFADLKVHLRLYQRVLVPNRVAGNAYWKALRLE
jgi:hypothetical protein